MAETEGVAPNATAPASGPVAAPAADPEAAIVAETGPDPSEQMLQALLEAPYTEETLKAMRDFFRVRAVFPDRYVYTATGDLEIKEGGAAAEPGAKKKRTKIPNLPPGVIQLKRYVPLEAEERALLEGRREEKLAQAEQEYEAGMTTLRAALAELEMARLAGGAGGADTAALTPLKEAALAANIRVRELDTLRNSVRSAVREIEFLDNPVANTILFNLPKETRKLFRQNDPFLAELVRLYYYDFASPLGFGKYVPDEAAPAAAAAAAEDAEEIRAEEAGFRKKLKDGRIARVFFDPKKSPVNNFLSPLWAVKLVIREAQYNFPLQAYEAERARELGKEDLRRAIMQATSPQTIRLATRKETAHPADARGLWLEIYTAVYQQNPTLKEQLLATGTDALVYADSRAGPSGVGIEEESPSVLDSTKWTGENIVGTVLETLRTRMREETLAEAPTGPVTEHAITEEEAEARRVGAIINAARRRNA